MSKLKKLVIATTMLATSIASLSTVVVATAAPTKANSLSKRYWCDYIQATVINISRQMVWLQIPGEPDYPLMPFGNIKVIEGEDCYGAGIPLRILADDHYTPLFQGRVFDGDIKRVEDPFGFSKLQSIKSFKK